MATQEATVETGTTRREQQEPRRFDTIVIGGGQAGLAIGYYLKKQGRSFVILDANDRIGGSWRTRTWHSLRLFTPARYDGLPGWSFPGARWSYPDGQGGRRLPRGVRGAFRASRAQRRRRSTASQGGRPLRRVLRRAALRGRPRRRRDRASTASRPFRTSRPSSIRASCRCTPASTAIRPSCGRATSSSSAPGNSGADIAMEVSAQPPDVALRVGTRVTFR